LDLYSVINATDELIAQSGHYAHLFTLQAQGYR